MKTNRLASLVGAVAILGAASGVHGVPLGTGFTYQGQLKKAGVPLNGTADFQFTLWDAAGSGNPPTGGTQIGNMQAISGHIVTGGLFTVALNPTGQFGANAFNGEARWLQIAVRSPAGGVGSFTTLSPRQPLTAAPHTLSALNAENSTQLNGQGPSFYQNAANLIAGTLNAARLPNPLTLSGNNASHIIKGENASAANGSSGVYGEGNYFGVHGAGNNVGVYGEGNDAGVFGVGNNVGVSGRSLSLLGQVSGNATNYGGYFETDSPFGRGVYGVAQGLAQDVSGGTFSKDARGVYGEANFTDGPAYGVYGESRSNDGVGVYGQATASFGETYGGYFWSNSATGGIGVYGLASAGPDVGLTKNGEAAALGGNTYGGYFRNDGVSGHGIYGYASNDSTTYGVRGRVDSPTGYAGYFEGRGYFEGNVGIGTTTPDNALDVNGNISVTASPFNEMVIKNSEVWTHANGAQTFGDGGGGAHFIVASKEGTSESAGVYGDGDSLTLWSPGDSISGQPFALMYVLDEDNFDGDGNPYNGGALKAYLADTGLWVQSDMRRKKDFASIDQACEKISQISAYTFEYIPSPEDVAKGDVPKRVPGLIAQEVEKVLPEAVAINTDGEYFMNYSLLVPFLIESVKELNERLAVNKAHAEPAVVPSLIKSVKELNESLAEKQAHIEALEARLAALEGRLSGLIPAEQSSGE